MKSAEQLADEHTEYMRKILTREMERSLELYREGTIHSIKHGREDNKNGDEDANRGRRMGRERGRVKCGLEKDAQTKS